MKVLMIRIAVMSVAEHFLHWHWAAADHICVMCLKNMADASVRILSNTGNFLHKNLFNKQLSKISAVLTALVGRLVSYWERSSRVLIMYASCHKFPFLEVCFVMWLCHPPALSEAGEPLISSDLFVFDRLSFRHSFTYAHHCFVDHGISETFASCSTFATISYVTVMDCVKFVTHSDKQGFALPSGSVVFEVCFVARKCPLTISQWIAWVRFCNCCCEVHLLFNSGNNNILKIIM